MSYTHVPSAFYDATKLEQIAINLFYSWGYNFYRVENQLRSDDLMLRSHLSTLLGLSRRMIETQQSAYRRKFLPPPTRERPDYDPEALESARRLEALSNAIGKIEGIIRSAQVPGNDRMTQRFRLERDTLVKLCSIDSRIIGQAETLRALLDKKDYQWILDHETDVQEGLTAIQQTMDDRTLLLA